MNFKNLLKDNFKKSKIFWIYRHFFNNFYWENQLNFRDFKRRSFYSKFILRHKLDPIIFEFGCGAGQNFHSISHSFGNAYCFGYDISSKGISVANKYKKKNWKFTSKITVNILEEFLDKSNSNEFSLAIYDRVLYMMSTNEIFNHFLNFGKYFKYIIIDDFVHDNDNVVKSGSYTSKNYEKILSDLNFQLFSQIDSQHKISQIDPFYEKSGKILIFEKINS